jgi:diguanylate cyclase (GGDEF)-like protein/PAS domain S-box-containing protein
MVITVPEQVLYAPVSGLAWLPWAVLAVLGLAGLVALRLVARRAAAERELAASEALHRHTVRHLPDAAVLVFDHDLRYTLAEGPALEALGWEPAELVGHTLREIAPPERLAEIERHYRAALAGDSVPLDWESVRGARRLEGTISPLRDEQGRVLGGLLVARDVTVRRQMEAQLRRLADSDPLTDLSNRRRFEQALATQAARCRRHGERAALLMMDLDRFKQVNDTHGHQTGDLLIRHVATTLARRVRASDVVARLGGDEFAVLLAHVTPDEAALTAESVATALREHPLVLDDGTVLPITSSIGIAFLDQRSADAERAMVNADVAMYDAKAAGRDRISGLREAASSDAPQVRVFHSDDSEPYRRLLGEMLRAHGDILVVGDAGDAVATLAGVAAARPDVILLDASLDEDESATVARLRETLPGMRVLVLSGNDACPVSLEALVDGFVPKSSSFDEIAAAVRG